MTTKQDIEEGWEVKLYKEAVDREGEFDAVLLTHFIKNLLQAQRSQLIEEVGGIIRSVRVTHEPGVAEFIKNAILKSLAKLKP